MRPVAAALPKIAAKAIGRRGFAEASLITEWHTVVGAELAKVSQPVKLAFPPGARTNGTLHISVQGGVATELQHLEPQVLERINGHFGYGAIARLRLVHAPPGRNPSRRARPRETERKPDAAQRESLVSLLSPVDDDDMRSALESLGAAILAREHRVKKS